MLSPDQRKDFVYLSEAIDALDRLYDGHSGATDVAAILRIAGTALTGRPLGESLVSAADQLRKAVGAASPNSLSGDDALVITDRVRVPISEAWSELYALHDEGTG